MGDIQYVGLKDLGDDATQVRDLIDKYSEKFDRDFLGHTLIVHTKLHNVGGRVKYSFHARIDHPQMLAKADASDWDLRRTVHKMMKALENEVAHKFKNHVQKQEKFHPKRAKRGTDTRVRLKQKRRTRT